MATKKELQADEARAFLRSKLAPGDTLWTSVKHVSRSGMQRSIAVYRVEDNAPWDISGFVARAIGARFDDKRGGVVVGGCGMDMGFHLVYSLSYALFPKGYGCVGKGCPSNDHYNGDRDYTSNSERQKGWAACDDCCETSEEQRTWNQGCPKHSHWHRDGGYALVQRWL